MKKSRYEITFTKILPNGKRVSANHEVTKSQYDAQFNFYRAGRNGILKLCNAINTPKARVISYLVNHMNTSYNCVLSTISHISRMSHASRPTVTDLLKKLSNKGLLHVRSGMILISPELIMKGSNNDYKRILEYYLSH